MQRQSNIFKRQPKHMPTFSNGLLQMRALSPSHWEESNSHLHVIANVPEPYLTGSD